MLTSDFIFVTVVVLLMCSYMTRCVAGVILLSDGLSLSTPSSLMENVGLLRMTRMELEDSDIRKIDLVGAETVH